MTGVCFAEQAETGWDDRSERARALLSQVDGRVVTSLIEPDARSGQEIVDARGGGAQVLLQGNLEFVLFDDEVSQGIAEETERQT